MIIKQRNIGTFLGMMKIIVGQCTPYINWVQLGLVAIMSFYTTLNPMFAGWGIQFPFWIFLVILAGIVIGIMTFEYTLMLPSYFGAANVQTWDAENPQRKLLEAMAKEIKASREENAEIKSEITAMKSMLIENCVAREEANELKKMLKESRG